MLMGMSIGGLCRVGVRLLMPIDLTKRDALVVSKAVVSIYARDKQALRVENIERNQDVA